MRSIISDVHRKVMISILIAFCILTACGLYIAYILCQQSNATDNASNMKRIEIQKIIWNAGNFAPLPAGAKIKEIMTEGNMFTRSFHMTFSAGKSELKQWLADSKSISKGRLSKTGHLLKYLLKPSCGYNYMEVKVDTKLSAVYIFLEWS